MPTYPFSYSTLAQTPSGHSLILLFRSGFNSLARFGEFLSRGEWSEMNGGAVTMDGQGEKGKHEEVCVKVGLCE